MPPANTAANSETLRCDIEHSDEVFSLDRKGNQRLLLQDMSVVQHKSETPDVIYHFVSKHVRQTGTPKPTAWTEQQALQVLSWSLNSQTDSPA